MIRSSALAACFILSLAFSLPSKAQLRMGSAAVKITPPDGTPMAGYYTTRLSEGVHDDLYSKAIVLEQGGVKAALVSLDIISTTREMVERARKEIERTTGIPGANVMIGATHAHTGPVLTTPSSRDIALGSGVEAVRKYNEGLPPLIAQSVKEADSRRAPVTLSAGIGREEMLSFNRRFHMKDGTVGWNPGKLNPGILRPAGPIDPEVGVLLFDGEDRKTLAAYVNFAMHLDTVSGRMISADYPHVLAKLLAEVKGPQLLTLFATGCCGNINHIDVSHAAPQGGNAEAFRIGTILAAETLKTAANAQAVPIGPLRVSREIVKLPLPELKPGDVERAEAAIAVISTPKPPPFLEQVGAFKIVDVAARKGRPQEVEVQVIALGDDVAWVSLPGEIFVELGLAIKQASPFKHTMIAELANGSIGYIPDRKAYVEGNYEVVSARAAAGSGELLVESAVRQLRALFREGKR
jgi:neutral ceramidase